ncbi:MAG: DEAD/DEAH box helicase [Synergistaceae bacterium]|nr:DEAD/DEAH box helicase [Synergistaceae bacterium]
MDKDKNGASIEFYKWQLDAYSQIRGESAVLSAPTGAGKTLVAYLWAGLLDTDGETTLPAARRVIFTAPIKALSNERYMDLRRMGFDVGIETGDFKRNEEARLVCCTQEIYTMKYTGRPGQMLIVDEFHYIFNDPDRARAYIDGIKNTHLDTPILVMSATLGGVKAVGRYLSKAASRHFVIHESRERMTRLLFKPDEPVTSQSAHDALIFLFSQKGASDLAFQIARTRKRLGSDQLTRLSELANILEVKKIQPPLLHGVGVYHGGMFPKEKLLVESAFRERVLDVVCGTNALALGVNLPAQYAVFAQLVQYHHDEPITKNEFLQMAGRAGRKGLFDPGFVTWLKDSAFEKRGFQTGQVFRALLDSPSERAAVTLRPSYGRLLRKQALPEAEAEYIARYSMPLADEVIVMGLIHAGLRKIDRVVQKLVRGGERNRYRSILAAIWYDEMEIDENLEMAMLFFEEPTPSALMAAQMVLPYERNYLQALLKVKRFANRLPKGYCFRALDALNDAVDEIDPTIYGFEEKLGEIDQGRLGTRQSFFSEVRP